MNGQTSNRLVVEYGRRWPKVKHDLLRACSLIPMMRFARSGNSGRLKVCTTQAPPSLFSQLHLSSASTPLPPRSGSNMRRALFIVTAVLAGTAAATQLPLGTEQAPSRPMSDPSFPQPGSGLDRLGGVGIGGSAGVPSGKGMTLADTLTVDRRGSVWWDYARDIGSVVSRK